MTEMMTGYDTPSRLSDRTPTPHRTFGRADAVRGSYSCNSRTGWTGSEKRDCRSAVAGGSGLPVRVAFAGIAALVVVASAVPARAQFDPAFNHLFCYGIHEIPPQVFTPVSVAKLIAHEFIRIVEMPDSPPNTEVQVGASVNSSSASASVTIAK